MRSLTEIQDIISRANCCLVKMFGQLYELETSGADADCMEKKVLGLWNAIDLLSQYTPIGEVLGQETSTVIHTETDPAYVENVSAISQHSLLLRKSLYDGSRDVAEGPSFGTGTLRVVIQKADGSFPIPIGTLDGTFVTDLDFAAGITTIINSNPNPAPGGVDFDASDYIFSIDNFDVTITQQVLANALRAGFNNTGAFRNLREVQLDFIRNYEPGECDYGFELTADEANGFIPCAGTPNAGTIAADIVVCPGGQATVTATGLSVGPGLSFNWQVSNDDGGVDPWTDIPGATGSSYAFFPLATAFYRLRSTCGNVVVSPDAFSNSVSVGPADAIDLQLNSNSPLCGSSALNLNSINNTAGQSGGLESWAWTGPGGFTSNQQNPTVNNPQVGDYVLLYTNKFGCQDTKSITCEINPLPVLNITLNSGGNVTVVASGGTGPYNYSLDFIEFNNTGEFTGVAPGDHTLGVDDAFGCTASINVTVV